jgi:hypothetical protein
MTEPASVADVAVPAGKTWHERTRRAVSDDRVASWRSRLTPAEIALCEAVLGPRLRACGYELSGASGASVGGRIRYAAVATQHGLGHARRAALHGWDRVRRAAPVAARLTSRERSAADQAPG